MGEAESINFYLGNRQKLREEAKLKRDFDISIEKFYKTVPDAVGNLIKHEYPNPSGTIKLDDERLVYWDLTYHGEDKSREVYLLGDGRIIQKIQRIVNTAENMNLARLGDGAYLKDFYEEFDPSTIRSKDELSSILGNLNHYATTDFQWWYDQGRPRNLY